MFRLRKLCVFRARDFMRASLLVLAIFLVLVSTGVLDTWKIPSGFSSGSVLTAKNSFRPPTPTRSSSIAISHNGQYILSVNPDVNTVTVLRPTPHKVHKHAEIGVGREPTSIAAHPDNNTAYVANAGDGTVSVLNIPSGKVRGTIRVGAEPMAVALSPNGSRLYVANSASNNLMVVDTSREIVIATIDLSPFGTAPRAMGIRTTLTKLFSLRFSSVNCGRANPPSRRARMISAKAV